MNTQTIKLLLLFLAVICLQGCVAFPPLIQVEHKDGNQEVLRRLDAIEHRLDALEPKVEKK